MRFTKIHLENWRNFTEADIDLQDRAFIIGPNASGKSNFLDAFRFLRDLAKDGGGLQNAVNSGRRESLAKIRSFFTRRKTKVAIYCDLVDPENNQWRYGLDINDIKANGSQKPRIQKEIVEKNGQILLERPIQKDNNDPELLFQTHLEQVSMNQQFRTIAEAFKSVRYLHLVPQLIREQARVKKIEADPFGSDFLEQIWRTNKQKRESRLNQIGKIIAIAVPHFISITCNKDNMGMPHLYFNYQHWRKYGARQTETELSDGTIRLIGLLWSLLEGNGLLLLEEPELSLHPEVVRHLPQMMAKAQKKNPQQIFISTHSWEILTDKGVASDEIVLLTPTQEGTEIKIGANIKEVKDLMESGFSAAEAAFTHTQPENINQLSLFEF
jgi:predicted ATPase